MTRNVTIFRKIFFQPHSLQSQQQGKNKIFSYSICFAKWQKKFISTLNLRLNEI